MICEGLKYNDVKRAVEEGNEKSKTKLAGLKLSGLGGAKVDEDGAVVLLEERVKRCYMQNSIKKL